MDRDRHVNQRLNHQRGPMRHHSLFVLLFAIACVGDGPEELPDSTPVLAVPSWAKDAIWSRSSSSASVTAITRTTRRFTT